MYSYRILLYLECLEFARSIPEVGQERAEKNAKLMDLYKDFFIPTERSHLYTFIIGLIKFFDKDPSSLSIKGLINEIKKNKDIFTVDILKDIYPHLKEVEVTDYSSIKQITIDYIEQIFKKHEDLIYNLKDIRNKVFAHTDMKTIKSTFVPNEIENLIQDIQEIFNRLSGDFDLSETTFSHIKNESVSNTRFLLESLERGEMQRQEDFRKKYGGYKLE